VRYQAALRPDAVNHHSKYRSIVQVQINNSGNSTDRAVKSVNIDAIVAKIHHAFIAVGVYVIRFE
jgi:uncharacterized Fe-S center protein